MKALLIANPQARRVGDGVSVEALAQSLRAQGLTVETRLSTTPSEGEQLAREAVQRGLQRVVVAGGDGTISRVLQGLAGSPVELAVIPLGTGNILANHLGLRENDLDHACRVAATGQTRTIDLGRLDDHYFVVTAGAGIDAEVSLRVDPLWKRTVGKLAFMTEFLRAMVQQEPHIYTVRIGDREIKGPMWGLLICNTNTYSWRIRPAPQAREDDGLLDVVFIHRQGFLDLLDLATRMFFEGETAEGHPTATVLRIGEMHLSSYPPVPWQIEGEVMGQTPVTVRVVPGALRLVVPDSDKGLPNS